MPIPAYLRLTPEQKSFAVRKFLQWLEDNGYKNSFDLAELLQAEQEYKAEIEVEDFE